MNIIQLLGGFDWFLQIKFYWNFWKSYLLKSPFWLCGGFVYRFTNLI